RGMTPGPNRAGAARWRRPREAEAAGGEFWLPVSPPCLGGAPGTVAGASSLPPWRGPGRVCRTCLCLPSLSCSCLSTEGSRTGRGRLCWAGVTPGVAGTARSAPPLSPGLDLGDLQKELQKSRDVFPENPSVWLKDLAGYLNYKLQAPRSDPALSQHPHGACPAAVGAVAASRSWDRKRAGSWEEHPAWRDRSLLLLCPAAQPPWTPSQGSACLSPGWSGCWLVPVQGQPSWTPPSSPAVWLGVMLPVLGIKSLSPYAVSYLDRLLMMHPNLTKGFGMIGPKDFFPLLDFAFMPNNSLSPSLQEQLRSLYPRLKVLALGARPEATLHTYFPSFLSRATPACPPAMKEELLTSLSHCLSLDPLSFGVWRQLYTKHLAQSRSVQTLSGGLWGPGGADTAPAVPKVHQSLQETVRSFKVTNEELAARGAGGDQNVAACDAACKELLCKMKGRGFPWSRLLLVLLVLAAGFLLHDVRTHGSFQGTGGNHGI
ncbi:TM214 protein, partial [Chloropsis hardwickii]|nr:TM214 protein [Chloropsis hardwickii]